MSEKNGKMKFKIGAKIIDKESGKCSTTLSMDCSPIFVIATIANLLVSEEGKTIAPLITEAVKLAEVAKHSSDPSATISKLIGIKSNLLAGIDGDEKAGMKGLMDMMSLVDEIKE